MSGPKPGGHGDQHPSPASGRPRSPWPVHQPGVRVASRSTLDAMPLLSRVFVCNAVILAVATLVLAISPATVSFPVALTEALVLGAGLGAMLILNLVLLR